MLWSGLTIGADPLSQRNADAYARDAAQSPHPQRNHLYTQAARAYWKAGQFHQAAAMADQVHMTQLPPADLYAWTQIETDIQRRASLEMDHITTPRAIDPNNPADIFRQSGSFFEAARTRIQHDASLTAEVQLDNQLEILRDLTLLSNQSLTRLQPSPPGVLGGWMDLAVIFKVQDQSTDLQTISQRFQDWRSKHPQHPASDHLPARYFGQLRPPSWQPVQIAVLLPDTGPLKHPALAIRQGIEAAMAAEKDQHRPLVKHYDTESQSIDVLYDQAVSEGAEAIIGPLNKEKIQHLAARPALPVPTLALNRIPDQDHPDNLYQFALWPESEARQAAERAWFDGHRNALILVPDTPWGQRLSQAFAQRYTDLGGRILKQVTYPKQAQDLTTQVQSLLNLDQSLTRHRALERTLGHQLNFEARIRQDADMLFLPANLETVRQIQPQIRFNHGQNLPLYATSRLFSGLVNPAKDLDLEAMRFPDAPWILGATPGLLSRQTISQPYPSSRTQLPRLFAMGIDSYRVLPQLALLANDTTTELEACSGRLHMDEQGRIERHLLWSEMRRGIPHILGYTPTRLPRNHEHHP